MAFKLPFVKKIFKKESTSRTHTDAALGIDIGASAIKIVQIRDEKGVPTLDTYGELQLGPYEGSDVGYTANLSADKLREALRTIIDEAGAGARHATFAFSYNTSYTNVITIPTATESEMSSMIPVEAHKYIPVPLSEVSLDWMPIETSAESKKTDVLLTAVYNDTVKQYEEIMQGTGLTVDANEIEIFSSIRSLVTPEDTRLALIDCGASTTRLYIVEGGIAKKTHSLTSSGVQLTKHLASTLNKSFHEAEMLKRTHGVMTKDGDLEVQKAIRSYIDKGFRELNTVIARYEKTTGDTIDKVVLSGGGAQLPGLAPYVQTMFSKKVVLATPFNKTSYPMFLQDTLKEIGPAFAVAVGSALHTYQNKNK